MATARNASGSELQAGDKFVKPGLVPGIHVFLALMSQNVDGRDKPGHHANHSRAVSQFVGSGT
jgi:hypothetical protein